MNKINLDILKIKPFNVKWHAAYLSENWLYMLFPELQHEHKRHIQQHVFLTFDYNVKEI